MSGTVPLGASHSLNFPRLPLSGPVFVILTAAGSSTRFGAAKKELLALGGASVLQRALEAFLPLPGLAGVLVTYPEGRLDEVADSIDARCAERAKALPFGLRFAAGGPTRQASVANGLAALCGAARAASPPLDPSSAVVLVHDAARPWVAAETIEAVLASAREHGACLPLADLPDTPKTIGPDGFVEAHPRRDAIMAAQTPQGFSLGVLEQVHAAASAEGWTATDDTQLWDRYVGKVAWVRGDRKNRKITYREDLPMETTAAFRIGEGWDIHPLVEGRRLVLGGVHLEHPKGEAGHSDGDVLWHAIIDALLGAAGLGDIGAHFPPSDQRWKDADSGVLAATTYGKVLEAGWEIGNIDATVILERPKLGPRRDAIRASIAAALGVQSEAVSVKAKTNEGFGEIGSGDAVEARAVVLLRRRAQER